MQAIKTLVIGGCLLVNFVAVLWTIATILNGATLGRTAIVSKDDAMVALVLLALSVVANVVIAAALVRRRSLRKRYGIG
jgi:hypothetical protein